MQKAPFEIELIIADDHSQDNTETIVEDLMQKHENGSRIKYTKHNTNKGVLSNSIWAYQQTKGKYLAVCEGDDYWTDPLKLEKQVTFLENNPEYSFCFHSVQIENEITGTSYPEITAENRDYNVDELLLSKILHTVSFVFRKEYLISNRKLSKIIFGLDGFLVLLMAEKGKLFGLKDEMAVYRTHNLGISNTEPKRLGILHQKRFIKQYIYFKSAFKLLPKKAINAKIVDYCIIVAKYYYAKKNPQALFYLGLAVYYRPDLIRKGFKKVVR